MYEVVNLHGTPREAFGQYGVALIGKDVIECYNSRTEARRRAKRLNALIEAKAVGRISQRKRIKG